MYPREPIYFVLDKLEPVKSLNVTYCGHWHKEFGKPIKRLAIDPYNGLVREEKRWLVCRNTIVNTAEYAVRDGFEESFPSQAHLTLSGKKSNKGIDVKWIRQSSALSASSDTSLIKQGRTLLPKGFKENPCFVSIVSVKLPEKS